MIHLDRLLERTVSKLPPDLVDQVVVFGGAPMVLCDLKPDVERELDLFGSAHAYDLLVRAGFEHLKDASQQDRVMVAEDVALAKMCFGVRYDEVHAASVATHGSHGLRVAALEHVFEAKLATHREDQQEDIRLLRKAIEPDARKTVLSWQAAVLAQDLDRTLALSHEDIEVGGPQGVARGHTHLGVWLARSGIALSNVRTFQQGPRLVIEQQASWTLDDGSKESMLVAIGFKVLRSRIASVVHYGSLDEALNALGLRSEHEVV
ncbi:MAG: hypothetical protein U0174_27025 [Polyangiaceae bacterium]